MAANIVITKAFMKKNQEREAHLHGDNMDWSNILKIRVDEGLQETVRAMIDTMYSKLFDDDTMTEEYDMEYVDRLVDERLKPLLLKEIQTILNDVGVE